MPAAAKRLSERISGAAAHFDRVLANPAYAGLIGTGCVAIMLVVHLRHSPQIFDIHFADETIYVGSGLSPEGVRLSSYEHNGLYALFYRFISFFIPDPVSLYLWGGAIFMAACGIAIYVSVWTVSRGPLFAMLVSAAFVFSGALTYWPRVSYAAIAVIAAGLSCAHFARSWLSKAGICLLTGFLATFIRPEYVIVFYFFLAVTAALAMAEVAAAMRAGNLRALARPELAPAWISVAALLVLMALWSFPLLRGDGRAFGAFLQHFSLRYVQTHGLSINPWWNVELIAGKIFPGAQSVADAARIAPQAFLGFLADNAAGTVKSAARFLVNTFSPVASVRACAGFLMVAAGVAIAARAARARRRASGVSPGDRGQILADACTAIVFMAPVLISCVLIYPRDHYLVILFYLLFMVAACLARRHFRNASSTAATLCVAAGLVIATPSLPRVPQPEVQSIAVMRAIPGIKVLLEADLGWCVYYRPRCRAIWPRVIKSGQSFSDMVTKAQADAIVLSRGLTAIAGVEDDPTYRRLRADPRGNGYEPVGLPNDRLLLLKR